MDLTYSDEQIALRDSAERYLKDRYAAQSRREPGSHWQAFADLGWLGIPFSPDHGGLGGSMVDVGSLAEAFGRHLVVEPYASSIVFAGTLIEHAAQPALKSKLLGPVIAGGFRFAVAHEETGRGPIADVVHTVVQGAPDNSRLRGAKMTVLDAGTADQILVTARRGSGKTVVCACDLDAPGLEVEMFPTVDGRTAARLRFHDTPAWEIGSGQDDTQAIALAVDRTIAVLGADMVGTMQAALDATVAYSKIRVQFGQPIGANQVVKHRLVEMAVKCEEARSIALKALILTSETGGAAPRARAVSAAKIKISKAARSVCEDAIQLHGGMGVTDELDIGGYLKRALAFEAVLGTSRWHKLRYAALGTDVLER